jgi:hypothetical protein
VAADPADKRLLQRFPVEKAIFGSVSCEDDKVTSFGRGDDAARGF